jgi:hypothetical protein
LQLKWLLVLLALCGANAGAQVTQPLVAIHDSELTRALETINATAPTPSGGLGISGKEWWPTNWHYFVMPESLQETLRSDGTAFTVVGDSNILAGDLLTNGQPRYPIVISLASEAIRDDEIAAFTNYVAAGGFLFVGSSAFTRHTNGTSRGDFAFADEMGIHMYLPALTNWGSDNTLTKQAAHRLVNHLPSGNLTWRLPTSAEEIPFGVSPLHQYQGPHSVWQVVSSNATVLVQGGTFPYILAKPYGKGCFIYCAAMQPLLAHGGWSPGMYAYGIFRNAIAWAFESARLPVPKLSPWPYPYDAAFMVRHDFENYRWAITNIEASAAFEHTNGAKGDYYFCTGTLKYELGNSASVIASLRRAVTNYSATIGSHNGGYKNPGNPALNMTEFDYWHWGPDEALDTSPTNFASGQEYALHSLSNSFLDIESWLDGINTGPRLWVSCYFNATREESFDIQDQLGVKINGEQKLGPFPHWTLSTSTSGKLYPMLSQPVSDWFVGAQIAQAMEYHTNYTMRDLVDHYYNWGALINLYSHSLSDGTGTWGPVASNYIVYSLNTNLHPRLWSANAIGIYDWWLQRSNARISVSHATTNLNGSVTTFQVSGATDPNTTVELALPALGAVSDLQILTNGVLAGGDSYRANGPLVKIRVGTDITNVVVSYSLMAKAQGDFFITPAGTPVLLASPGVMSNDSSGLGGSNLVASLVAPPINGTAYLTNNGGLTYLPATSLTGWDSFSYQVNDGISNSAPGTITVSVLPEGTLFADDFARPADVHALSPWQPLTGTWSLTNGALRGTSSPGNYAIAWISNDWSAFCVQATVRFPAGAYGGGLGGQLNPVTGAHYAAWIYPEGSSGGSNVLKLIKFQNWTTFSYNGVINAVMAQTNLAAVGTNAHTLKLAFHGRQIGVSVDGSQLLSVTDEEAVPLSSGGICANLWNADEVYTMAVDDVLVRPVVLPESYTINGNTLLTVAPPGVLANDTAVYGSLTAALGSGPTYGTLSLSNNGAFVYAAVTNFGGTDTFTYFVDDGPTNLGLVTVAITVMSSNSAPALPAPANRTIDEVTTLTVTNTATDVNVPADVLTYTLLTAPSGASISTNGIITWTPAEDQGNTTNVFTTWVADSGSPNLSDTNSFVVMVNDVNLAPVLPVQTNRTIAELSLLVVTDTASDSDIPVDTLSYSLLTAPSGAAISATGVITWTPTEAQGPSTNAITTVVTDNGTPNLSATNVFVVVVNEVNAAPVLPSQSPRTIGELTTLTVTNTATDADLPTNSLSYTLLAAPPGAAISAVGVITWTPDANQGPSTNVLTTRVVDNGTPNLSATNSFTVIVNDSCQLEPVFAENFDGVTAPGLPAGWTTDVSGGQSEWVTQSAVTHTPLNAAFAPDPATNGVSTLTSPAIALPVGESVLAFRNNYNLENETGTATAYDGGVLEIKIGTNAFADIVAAGGTFLGGGYNSTIVAGFGSPIAGRQAWSGSSAGFVPTLVNLPAAAAGETIQLRWLCATDNDAGAVGWHLDTIAISNLVCATAHAPELPTQTNRTIPELSLLTVTNTATDADGTGGLTYSLVNPPAGAVISASGVITWTPTEAQGPGTNMITSVVKDGPVTVTNSFAVTVTEVNVAPAFVGTPTNRSVARLTLLTVTNSATDGDLPANPLTYSLVNAPSGAAIDTNGVITWTPTEAQAPSTNTITSVVNDGTVSVTNSFMVTVTEVNTAPAFVGTPTNRAIAELTLLTVTNLATDADLPPNTLTYSLVDAPGGAVISASGVITWTPTEAQGPSTNAITTVVTDNGTPNLSATNSFVVVVDEVNLAPVLPSQSPRTIGELTTLTVTNTATDADLPTNSLSYTLLAAPPGAAISAVGVITWTPDANQGPSTNVFTTRVVDNGTPNLSATNSFTVIVNDSCQLEPVFAENFDGVTAPALPAGWTTDVSGGQSEWVTQSAVTHTPLNAAFAPDPATNGVSTLTSPAIAVPVGESVLAFWNHYDLENQTNTSTGYDGGVLEIKIGTNAFADIIAAGGTFLGGGYNSTISSDFGSPIAGRQAWSGSSAGFVLTLVSLPAAAAGQTIQLRWLCGTDSDAGAVGWYLDTIAISNLICATAQAPELPAQTNRAIPELSLLTVTNIATDADGPGDSLTYSLTTAPAGATIDTNGVITWTPTEVQGPSTNIFTTVVTDSASLSATNSFEVTVTEVNEPPVFAGTPTNRTIAELTLLTVTNHATDADVPANTLTYSLVNAPVGAVIDTNGVIMWTPTEAQGPITNTITTVVNDGTLNVTNSFEVTVTEVNVAPAFVATPTNRIVTELTLLTVTNHATDADLPANALTYSLVNPPAGATIDTNGVVTWIPGTGTAPSTNLFLSVVSDDGLPPLTATNAFFVVVLGADASPVILSATAATGMVTLTSTALPGRSYRLESKDSFALTNWTELLPDQVAAAPTVSWTNAVGSTPQRFYRIRLLPLP